MPTSIRTQTELLIAASRADFEGRDWWDSDRKEDVGNRRHVEMLWREFLQNCDSFNDGIASVERLLAKLTVVGEKDRFVVGYSVGFKRPGPGEIRWADIKGAEDPMEASRNSQTRDDVKRWLREDYHEYGISPMIEWRPRKHEPVATTDAASPRPGV
jgi:hypothetical protein